MVELPSVFRHSTNLKVIDIRTSKIGRIYKNTFRDLPTLVIFLHHCNITEISPGAFLNLTSLEILAVSENQLKTIPRGVYKDLPRLHTLELPGNEISSIDDNALENLPQLGRLNLNHNKIEAIFIHKVLSHPEQLEQLHLWFNSLTILNKAMLQKLTKLKVLALPFNKISVIETHTFEQTPQLKDLFLNHNKLKEVDGNIFPRTGLNYLDGLMLDNNELMFLSANFFFRLRSLTKMSISGNPWFCTCLDYIRRIMADNGIRELVSDAYIEGRKPICVRSAVCSYEYDKDLSDIYMDAKKIYPASTLRVLFPV